MFFVYGAENSRASDKAEFLLYSMGLNYRLYIFGRDYTLKQLHRLVPDATTVPHVYHGAKYIGGVKELYEYVHSDGVISNAKRESKRSERILSKSSEDEQSGGDIHEE